MKQFTPLLFLISTIACGTKTENVNTTTTDNTQKTKKETVKESTMIFFKGGTFNMGSNTGTPYEIPAHNVTVGDFKLDKSPVTVASFAAFIKATSYQTDAERFGDAGVYNYELQKWELKKGAYWLYPLGREASKAEMNHPVTQVSWNDAMAYCQWAKKRLPTEAEWEYAARNGGKSTTLYSWGNALNIDGKYFSNVWQGKEIMDKQGADGFIHTSPVGHYGVTEKGLTDMGGNVWNWCSDVFNTYPGSKTPYNVDQNAKVMRGGSFFFDQNLDKSYTVSFRAPNTVETSLFNIGFRCASNP